MKLLLDYTTLKNTFEELCNKYDYYEWSVAWAGNIKEFEIAKLLSENISKVKRIVVGLHFYQTHPSFIEAYINNKNIKYIMQTDGTFHPKVYLFYNSDKDWSAIIGSSNFTYSAFNKNTEANVLISSDYDNSSIFSDIKESIYKAWELSDKFDKQKLDNYKECYHYQAKNGKSLSKAIKMKENGEFETTKFDLWTWDTFCNNVTTNDMSNLDSRFNVLEKAHSIFTDSNGEFNNIDPELRKCLAGFKSTASGYEDKVPDFMLFGSTVGARRYKKAINSYAQISSAIDIIPLKGDVSKDIFEKYCEKFYKEFENPLGTATRLLAIKRPDLFVCINNKNKTHICRALKIPMSRLKLNTYWELIIERIRQTEWYKDDGNYIGLPGELKKYKVAMLDSLYYKYSKNL